MIYYTETTEYRFEPIEVPAPVAEPEVTHHVFVIDRSGSMSGDISGLKSTIEQVLAAESLLNENVETTLISFSSHGDVTLHWSHVRANEVTELANPYLGILRSIRATFLTGISQALNLALDQVKDNQTTGITLFTDGYANDPSASQENKAIAEFVKRAVKHENVFVNCIGYRDWCDWPLMNRIANELSGKCVKATSFKSVLSAMKDTQALLAGRLRPAIRIKGVSDGITLAINKTTGQVNAVKAGTDLVLRGVGAEEQLSVYYVLSTVNTQQAGSPCPSFLIAGLTLGLTGLGALRQAKEVLFSSRNITLWDRHQSAMTPSTLAAMISDLMDWVKAPTDQEYQMGENCRAPYDLIDLANTINALQPRSLGIDVPTFMESYRRRSIKSIPGKRADDGTIIPPLAELVPREDSRTYIRGISFNRSDASVQVDTETAVWVKRLLDGEVLKEVEFVSLDGLREIKSYTLISSGERNIEIFPVQVYTKSAWKALSMFLPNTENFTPGMTVNLPLRNFKIEANLLPSPNELKQAVNTLHSCTSNLKILTAMFNKAEASHYTLEQLDALKALHLTPSLYFSAPSTVPYTDKDEAVKNGEIDSFTRYKINFGTNHIRSTDAFPSANALLDKRFVTKLNGTVVPKAKLDTYLQGATYESKPQKKETSPADFFMGTDMLVLLAQKFTNDQLAEKIDETKAKLERIYSLLQPIVMEIGCTGLLPVEYESKVTRLEAEEFEKQFEAKLTKDEKEAVFFVFPPSASDGPAITISVTPETSWYSV